MSAAPGGGAGCRDGGRGKSLMVQLVILKKLFQGHLSHAVS